MPKAPINEYNSPVFRKNYIWFARQILDMKPISETMTKQELPDDKFRFCVLPFNLAHVKASGCLSCTSAMVQK